MNHLFLAGPFGIGFQELLLVAVIVIVVFGANKLPQIGDGMGRMITNFRKSVKGGDDGGHKDVEVTAAKDRPADKIPGA